MQVLSYVTAEACRSIFSLEKTNILSVRSKLEKLRKIMVYMQCTVKIHQTNGIGATYSLYPNYFITDFSKISPQTFQPKSLDSELLHCSSPQTSDQATGELALHSIPLVQIAVFCYVIVHNILSLALVYVYSQSASQSVSCTGIHIINMTYLLKP